MYRNCWAKSERQPNGSYGTTVYLTTWDKDGKPVVKVQAVKPYLYYEAPSSLEHLATATSMFGKPLIKKEFITQGQRKQWCDAHQGVPTYENLPVTRQFLLNTFHGQERNEDFSQHPLKVWTLDIEIAVNDRGEFPEALEAKFPINVISVYDSIVDQYFIWYNPPQVDEELTIPYVEKGVNDDGSVDISNRHYFRFKSETSLLADFMDFFSHNRPDVLTGWNISAYDMPYIYNRSKMVLGSVFDVDGCLSPSGSCYFSDDENVMTKILKIAGVSILDAFYLTKFKFERGKPSYALESVLDDELGLGKLDHSEYPTFYDFYTKNFSKFIEYNIMDVERVVRLDKKKQFIALVRKICNMGLVEYEAIYHTLPYVQGAIIAQAKYDDKIFMSTSGRPEQEGGFKGAYVHQTKTGFYKRGGYTLDLNSLYPNIMNTLNCSPETKVGVFRDDPNDESTVVFTPYSADKEIKIPKDKLEQLLDSKFCCSANNVLYLKPEIQKGIMPKFLEFLYTERRETKNKGLQCDVKINELRVRGINDGEEVERLKTQSTLYNNTQQAYKIMLNSVYGIVGLKHYCCYDKDSAEAVTQTGQAIIKKSLDIIVGLHEDLLGYTGEHPTLGGDTDSIMNDGGPIYTKLWGDKKVEWTKEEVGLFKTEAKKLCNGLNAKIDEWVHDRFHTSVSRIEFKLETVFSHAAFLKPKHYCYRKVDEEGSYMVGSPKQFKYTGVDIKRNLIPKKIQNAMKYCIEHGMLEEWSDQQFQDFITQQYKTFKEMTIEEISFQFAYRTEAKASGFLQMEPRASIVAKVSTFYNQMIERLELKNQKKIHLGDVAKYVHIKPDNQFGIEVMGFNEEWPAEFRSIFEVDRKLMFQKLFGKLEGFMDVLGWTAFDPDNEPEVDIFSL